MFSSYPLYGLVLIPPQEVKFPCSSSQLRFRLSILLSRWSIHFTLHTPQQHNFSFPQYFYTWTPSKTYLVPVRIKRVVAVNDIIDFCTNNGNVLSVCIAGCWEISGELFCLYTSTVCCTFDPTRPMFFIITRLITFWRLNKTSGRLKV